MITATAKRAPATKQAPNRKSLSVLDRLKQTANDKHKVVSRGLRTTLKAAREAGEALAQIKEKVGHGNWSDWVEKNFDASIQTARKYIKIYEQWDDHKLGDKDITIERACKVIKNFPDNDGDEPQTDLKGSKKKKADKKPDEKAKSEDWLTLPFDEEVCDYVADELPDGVALKEFIIILLKEAIAARRAKA